MNYKEKPQQCVMVGMVRMILAASCLWKFEDLGSHELIVNNEIIVRRSIVAVTMTITMYLDDDNTRKY